MRILKIIITSIIAISVLTGCGGNKLVGRWEDTQSSQYIEFFSDGTYTSKNDTGNYSIDGDRLKLSDNWGNSAVITVDISGNKMIVYDEEGSVAGRYEKK